MSEEDSFIGSYFNAERQLAELLNPQEIDATFELYGHNWEKHSRFAKYTKGPIAYENVFDVHDEQCTC